MSIASTDSAQFRVIGARPLRPDGVDKVTGRAVYGADVTMPGLLHGKVLRSKPEFEDCKALARRHGMPLAEVYAAIRKVTGN